MLAILYWVFLVLAVAIGGYWNRDNYGYLGGFGIAIVLFIIIGLKVFPVNLN